MKPLLLGVLALIALLATLYGVFLLWHDLGVDLSLHGWIAYGLGALVSLGLAFVLFGLTFRSSKSGFDDIDRPEMGED